MGSDIREIYSLDKKQLGLAHFNTSKIDEELFIDGA